MERFIPYEKLGKKAKKAINDRRRAVWAMSPVTKRTENKKIYNRKKSLRREELDEGLFKSRIKGHNNVQTLRDEASD